jgi:hypothetical protein
MKTYTAVSRRSISRNNAHRDNAPSTTVAVNAFQFMQSEYPQCVLMSILSRIDSGPDQNFKGGSHRQHGYTAFCTLQDVPNKGYNVSNPTLFMLVNTMR